MSLRRVLGCLVVAALSVTLACGSSTETVRQTYGDTPDLTPYRSLGYVDGKALLGDEPAPKRMIAKSAEVVAEVEDCDSAVAAVRALLVSHDGYVTESRLEVREDGRKRAMVAGRVAAEDLDSTLAVLPRLFSKIISVRTGGTDVTDEYYDVTGRLENRRALEERYRELFKRAGTTQELLEIQRALADLDNDIDRLEGRRRLLSGSAELASLSVHLTEPVPVGPALATIVRSRIKEGIDSGLLGLGSVLAGAITLVVVGIPTAIGLFVVALLVVRLVRRSRRRRLGQTGTLPEGRPGDSPNPTA